MEAWRYVGNTVYLAVVRTLREYGGWWSVGHLAYWLDADEGDVRKVDDKLEADGVLERKHI